MTAMAESLTGSQILCHALLEEGVDLLFGYPGGAIMPFYHALPEFPQLRHVLVRHEQAAAHAADGFARASGRAGVSSSFSPDIRSRPPRSRHSRVRRCFPPHL